MSLVQERTEVFGQTAQREKSLVHDRTDAVRETIARVKAAQLALNGAHPEQDVDQARAALLDLAARKDLFPIEQFPFLYETRSGFYRIGEDADQLNALYVQVSTTHGANPPHKHPYFAIITGVQGDEVNFLYERVDDGAVPGKGKLGNRREVHIKPGVSLYIPQKDFHTINVEGDEVGIHLHFYAIAVDTPEHRGVQRFKTPDSEDIIVRTEPPESGAVGVQRIALTDLYDAEASGRPTAFLSIDSAHAVKGIDVAHVALDEVATFKALPQDTATPIILIGEGKPVRVAAERLARRGYFSTFWFDPAHG